MKFADYFLKIVEGAKKAPSWRRSRSNRVRVAGIPISLQASAMRSRPDWTTSGHF
jgi:hypothetical protein